MFEVFFSCSKPAEHKRAHGFPVASSVCVLFDLTLWKLFPFFSSLIVIARCRSTFTENVIVFKTLTLSQAEQQKKTKCKRENAPLYNDFFSTRTHTHESSHTPTKSKEEDHRIEKRKEWHKNGEKTGNPFYSKESRKRSYGVIFQQF